VFRWGGCRRLFSPRVWRARARTNGTVAPMPGASFPPPDSLQHSQETSKRAGAPLAPRLAWMSFTWTIMRRVSAIAPDTPKPGATSTNSTASTPAATDAGAAAGGPHAGDMPAGGRAPAAAGHKSVRGGGGARSSRRAQRFSKQTPVRARKPPPPATRQRCASAAQRAQRSCRLAGAPPQRLRRERIDRRAAPASRTPLDGRCSPQGETGVLEFHVQVVGRLLPVAGGLARPVQSSRASGRTRCHRPEYLRSEYTKASEPGIGRCLWRAAVGVAHTPGASRLLEAACPTSRCTAGPAVRVRGGLIYRPYAAARFAREAAAAITPRGAAASHARGKLPSGSRAPVSVKRG
jgi:hypothetical protein